uniref:Uncharacterized protein n=1 Tax=Rhodopseudomonas palustris (strain ATCC BAA-98 / CGA009) TaxID=258594 RepID=Q6N266_RHOPA|nr:hypothetical protein RPA4184 [Rhodopseudomonas palustris CGA009]
MQPQPCDEVIARSKRRRDRASGRPAVPDPARQAGLADFAGSEGKDDLGRMGGSWFEGDAVLGQKDDHRHEGDLAVPFNKRFTPPGRLPHRLQLVDHAGDH